MRKEWAAAAPGAPARLDTRDGIGFLHVPAMGRNFDLLVKKGTSTEVLNEGVAGYYTDPTPSALPWAKTGNFTLAAHRDGHGAKFHNINKIHDGDAIVFESKDTWYVYKVYRILDQTSKYNVAVTDQVPKESGQDQAGPLHHPHDLHARSTPPATATSSGASWSAPRRSTPRARCRRSCGEPPATAQGSARARRAGPAHWRKPRPPRCSAALPVSGLPPWPPPKACSCDGWPSCSCSAGPGSTAKTLALSPTGLPPGPTR